MKEFSQKISRLGEDIRAEIELRREGFFRGNKELEEKFQPARPFMAKLRPEVLVGILVGVVIVGGIIRMIGGSAKKRKD